MRIHVIGIGNVLMQDDGVGPHVVRVLQAGWAFPENVTVTDLGTPGLDLVPHVADVDALVAVDAARTSAAPGTVLTWRGEDLLRRPAEPRLGPHDPGLEATLRALEFAGRAPHSVLLVGVVPARVEEGLGLTREVRTAVPDAIDTVLAELERLDAAARPQEQPAVPDLWWERPPAWGGSGHSADRA